MAMPKNNKTILIIVGVLVALLFVIHYLGISVKVSRLSGEVAASKNIINQKDAEIRNLNEQLALKQKELDAGKSELEAGRSELNDLKKELDSAKKELDDANAGMVSVKKALDSAKRELANARQELGLMKIEPEPEKA